MSYGTDRHSKILHIDLDPKIKVASTWIEHRIIERTVGDEYLVVSVCSSEERALVTGNLIRIQFGTVPSSMYGTLLTNCTGIRTGTPARVSLFWRFAF